MREGGYDVVPLHYCDRVERDNREQVDMGYGPPLAGGNRCFAGHGGHANNNPQVSHPFHCRLMTLGQPLSHLAIMPTAMGIPHGTG